MIRTPSRRLLQGLAAIACFVLAACSPRAWALGRKKFGSATGG